MVPRRQAGRSRRYDSEPPCFVLPHTIWHIFSMERAPLILGTVQALMNTEAPDEDAASKPDYNFKFNPKAKALIDIDTTGIAEKAKVKKKKKIVDVMTACRPP